MMKQTLLAGLPQLGLELDDTTQDTLCAFGAAMVKQNEVMNLTGITDDNTWTQIAEAYEPALIRVGKAEPIEILLEPGEIILFGQKSPYVYLLQGILAQLSADYETIRLPALTGTLDADTSDALRAFQVLADLPPTGTLDRITWKHLSRQFTLSAARNTSKRTN